MRKQTTFVVNPRYFAKIYQADRATMNEKCVFTELKQTFSKSLKYRHILLRSTAVVAVPALQSHKKI